MIWFSKRRTRSKKVRGLEKQVLDLQAKLDAAERAVAVLESERDSLAAVVARDRMRVAAETAIAARQRADAEGVEGGRTVESKR